MTIKIGINGFGRIGRNVARAIFESGYDEKVQLVVLNDPNPLETNAHLLKYDSVHGKFLHDVQCMNENTLQINGQQVHFTQERDPVNIPWGEYDVDVVFECTGKFTSREKAVKHLQSGAKKVLVSAPAGKDVPTIVYGVNEKSLTARDDIVSNASCTTNCLAPVVKPLHEAFGIQSGLMTTVHAYTGDQRLIDGSHKDLRRARSATQSIIPTKTGAAAAVGLVLPELAGKLDGYAVRVPTINVSMVDLTFTAEKSVSVEKINEVMLSASQNSKGVLDYNALPLVSIDFNHNPASSIFDSTQTRAIGQLVKIVAWYDNEWGFSNRMLDTASVMMSV